MPMSLPGPKVTTDSVQETNFRNNLEAARKCPGCGRPGRVVSNNNGVNVFCGPCKRHWPISNSPLRPELPGSPQRGLHKVTSVEPDWNIAFDRDVGDNS
jgi:hypothetical protein